jgi:hypothetical protein
MKSLIDRLKKRPIPKQLSKEYKGALEEAVNEKGHRRYIEALHIVDDILKDDPNIPVAAFIKATILWEGFQDSYTAKLGLQRVKQLVPNKKDRLHLMAAELIAEIERSKNKN